MARKVHVFVLPFPTQGHINPMLQFSKRLASKGLIVTLITTQEVAMSMEAQAADHHHPVKIEFVSDEFQNQNAKESHINGLKAILDRIEAVMSRGLYQLVQKLNSSESEHSTKVVVYDSGMPWALQVAKKLGLKGAAFFTQSCAVSAVYYHLYKGDIKLPLEESEVSLPSLPVLKLSDLPSFLTDCDSYPGGLDLVLGQFLNIENADWLLFNTFSKLEEEILKWMGSQLRGMKTIGPTIPSMYMDKRLENDKDYGLNLFKPSSETCIKWLDTKPKASVVYAAFGSLASLGEGQMEEVARGLENSDCYFLWVVRESEQSKLPGNFTEDTFHKGLIVNWSPQLDVLAHQAVGCFMTHCGWNSILEALSLGVPMVAMPQWTDQPTNAKCIVDLWHVGTRLKANEKEIISREEIERCIREVIEGERGNELRRNAIKWKELVKEAVGEGGSSDKNIEEFVKEVVSI